MKAKAIQLTVVLMIATIGLFAQSSSSEVWTSMILKGSDKVEIRMIKPANQVVTLQVYNEQHSLVYSKRIKKQSNLLISHYITEFPNGTYTYEVKDGKELVSATAIIKSSNKDLAYKPVEEMAEAKK